MLSDSYRNEHTPWWHGPQLRSLCLVSRHWREIVLATPSLWTSIVIDFYESVEKLDSWWRQATQRVKSAPAVVVFHSIGRNYSFFGITDPKLRNTIEERFRHCSLRAIPRIRTLQLNVAAYLYPFDVLSLMQEFPTYELDRLEITGSKPERDDGPKPNGTWNTLLHRFPPFRSLEMAYVGPVIFSQLVPFVALVDLYIADASEVNITTILAVCPNLRRLSIYPMYGDRTLDVSDMDPPRQTPHYLRFLKVDMVENFPWDRLGQLPSLSELYFGRGPATPQAVIDFIQAYTSITSLSLHVRDPRLVQLALVAPQLISIVIMSQKPDLEVFLDWKAAGMDTPAFPMLHTVKFYALLNLQTFEAFVRKRCLPKSHPDCALEMGLHPVRRLHLRREGKWLRSKYIAGATLHQFRVNLGESPETTLSWV
jgi:F-box-like